MKELIVVISYILIFSACLLMVLLMFAVWFMFRVLIKELIDSLDRKILKERKERHDREAHEKEAIKTIKLTRKDERIHGRREPERIR